MKNRAVAKLLDFVIIIWLLCVRNNKVPFYSVILLSIKNKSYEYHWKFQNGIYFRCCPDDSVLYINNSVVRKNAVLEAFCQVGNYFNFGLFAPFSGTMLVDVYQFVYYPIRFYIGAFLAFICRRYSFVRNDIYICHFKKVWSKVYQVFCEWSMIVNGRKSKSPYFN